MVEKVVILLMKAESKAVYLNRSAFFLENKSYPTAKGNILC
jgi:hypothetical protein